MRVTFRVKVLGLVAIAALALLVLVVADTLSDRSVNRHLVSIQQQFLPKVGLRPELEGHLERIARSLQDAAAASDQDLLAASRKQRDAFMARLTAARAALEPADAAALEKAVDAYYGAAEKVTGRLITGETGEDLVDEMTAMQERHAQAIEILQQATAFDETALTEAFAAATSAQRTASRIRLAVSLACLLLVVLLSLWFSRGVIRSLAGLTAGFERFGEGDFARPIPVTSGDELGDVANRANEMARSLERLHTASARGDWQKGGRAGLAQELRGELEPEEVADRAVAFLTRYLGAPLGALYYRESEGVLGLLGRYAPSAAPGVAPAARFRHGEGLVGQAALGTDISVIESPSEGHLRIRSGLAEGSPRAVVLLPLVHLGRVTGVLELAVLATWTEEAAELLLSVRDTVAIAIEVARGRSATRALLAETHQQNAELEDARRRLEQKADELASASAYKSQFLASMSHELRTPLNAILGFAELIHDGAVSPDSPQHKEFLGDILTSGRHLLQLINDVLDLAKVEAGKLEFRPERLNLDQVIREVLAIMRTIAAGKRIQIETRIDPTIGEVVLDAARLKQVLYNFVSNALKFTAEGGRVLIRAALVGEESFRLEVEDSGIGISPEDQKRLFIEFQQLGGREARRAGGTGLGLALTKRLVEAQGGVVGVDSAQGQGSTFWAVLPRRAQARPAATKRLVAMPREGGASVLVVEDERRDQEVLVAALTGAGYSVEVAATGSQAVARCRERRFAAITLDLLLPDMSGLEVMQQIRSGTSNRDVPIIVITVVAERGSVAGFAVSDILPKPLDAGSLLAALSRAGVSPTRSGAVLVVDDDPGSLKLMTTTLAQLGYQTCSASDGESALMSAEGTPPSAVVLDLMMPGMNGFEFLARLRSQPSGQRVPVIVWTVKDLNHEEHALLRSSAQAVVAKGQGGPAAVVAELAAFLRAGEA